MVADEPHDVARPITDNWAGDPAQRRQDQFPESAIRYWLIIRIENLGNKLRLEQMHAARMHGAFTGDGAGFSEAIAIETFGIPQLPE